MFVRTTRPLRFTAAPGTFTSGIMIAAETDGEVPNAVGKTMVEAGEVIELKEIIEYDMVDEMVDGPADKDGKPTQIPSKRRIEKSRSYVPKLPGNRTPAPDPPKGGEIKEPAK